MHEVKVIYLEALKHQESYGCCFWRLNDIEKVTRANFTGCKALSKVESMYLEVKLKEAKFK